MTVVDASAIVDLLLPPDAALRDVVIDQLPSPATPWLAPDVLAFEVFSAVRRHVLRGVLEPRLALAALRRLQALPIVLIPALGLLDAAWRLCERSAAADALYLALARRADEPLLSTDGRLCRTAAQLGIDVIQPPRPT